MAADRGAYFARIVDPIEAALPSHAHIDEDKRKWIATWTTSDGVWKVAFLDPALDATRIAVTGPRVQLLWEYPPSSVLLLHLLRELGAVDRLLAHEDPPPCPTCKGRGAVEVEGRGEGPCPDCCHAAEPAGASA
jgi:hypothetical protein